MLKSIKHCSLFFLAIAAIAFGCKSSSTGPTAEPIRIPGEFGYSLNGQSFDRKNYPVGNVTAYASLGGATGSKILGVTMMINFNDKFTSSHYVTVNIPIGIPATGSYSFSLSKGKTAASGFVQINAALYPLYISNDSGSVIITKFDTVNNIVSGTFNFDAVLTNPQYDTSQIMHVISGYFNEIPIDIGSTDQGTMTATIDDEAFSTISGNPGASISANSKNGKPDIQVTGWDGQPNATKELSFVLYTPKLGVYDLIRSNPVFAILIKVFGKKEVIIASGQGATGNFTLTKFDSVSHRLSGTFDFSGFDSSAGKPIHVANGVIDNVRWVVQ